MTSTDMRRLTSQPELTKEQKIADLIIIPTAPAKTWIVVIMNTILKAERT